MTQLHDEVLSCLALISKDLNGRPTDEEARKGWNSFAEYLAERTTSARVKLGKTREFSIAFCCAGLVGVLAMIMDDDTEAKPIPSAWSGKGPDPNYVLFGTLTQLSNLCLGALRLFEAGLVNPGRVLFRSALEVAWLNLVLAGDEKLMAIYKMERSDEETKEIWQKYFSPKKLSGRLEGLLRRLQIEYFHLGRANERLEMHNFYSQAVHNSFIHSAIMAYVESEEDKDIFVPAMFGSFSQGAVSGVDLVSDLVLMTLLDFIRILRAQHGFKIPCKDESEWLQFCASCLSLIGAQAGMQSLSDEAQRKKEFQGIALAIFGLDLKDEATRVTLHRNFVYPDEAGT